MHEIEKFLGRRSEKRPLRCATENVNQPLHSLRCSDFILRFCEMNTGAENDCSIAENIDREQDTVEVYHFPVAVKQELVATLPEEQ